MSLQGLVKEARKKIEDDAADTSPASSAAPTVPEERAKLIKDAQHICESSYHPTIEECLKFMGITAEELSADSLKKRYRNLARKQHPDVDKKEGSAVVFQALQKVTGILEKAITDEVKAEPIIPGKEPLTAAELKIITGVRGALNRHRGQILENGEMMLGSKSTPFHALQQEMKSGEGGRKITFVREVDRAVAEQILQPGGADVLGHLAGRFQAIKRSVERQDFPATFDGITLSYVRGAVQLLGLRGEDADYAVNAFMKAGASEVVSDALLIPAAGVQHAEPDGAPVSLMPEGTLPRDATKLIYQQYISKCIAWCEANAADMSRVGIMLQYGREAVWDMLQRESRTPQFRTALIAMEARAYRIWQHANSAPKGAETLVPFVAVVDTPPPVATPSKKRSRDAQTAEPVADRSNYERLSLWLLDSFREPSPTDSLYAQCVAMKIGFNDFLNTPEFAGRFTDAMREAVIGSTQTERDDYLDKRLHSLNLGIPREVHDGIVGRLAAQQAHTGTSSISIQLALGFLALAHSPGHAITTRGRCVQTPHIAAGAQELIPIHQKGAKPGSEVVFWKAIVDAAKIVGSDRRRVFAQQRLATVFNNRGSETDLRVRTFRGLHFHGETYEIYQSTRERIIELLRRDTTRINTDIVPSGVVGVRWRRPRNLQ